MFAQSLAHVLIIVLLCEIFLVSQEHPNLYFYFKNSLSSTRCLERETDIFFSIQIRTPLFLNPLLRFLVYMLTFSSMLFLTLK